MKRTITSYSVEVKTKGGATKTFSGADGKVARTALLTGQDIITDAVVLPFSAVDVANITESTSEETYTDDTCK